ncbi:PspC domain-containing protein [Gordonia sp. HY002]|uniref:PspC domain-containing protein n=1 Tax=Gordonia zhenghanii TaxID=2911516 RepID=UPI001EF00A63|nr:PspC domain-containing protein [Gordonia zhenghanii]MCF8570473.1 PspC domain-containing protein [Gordonia zhenghanii]MCF8602570.1 PspC domain-containing protein [Gordonia zhenghanii]
MNASTLQNLWNTRPVRRRSGNTIAGVCVGIGDRYRVDPTLVKVAFVVAALFGGSGVIAYIAAAIAFPAEDERTSQATADGRTKGCGSRRMRHRGPGGYARWIPLAILVVVAVSVVGSQNFWGSSGLLGGLLMAAGWWLLYQRTPQAPAGTSADQLVEAHVATPAPVFEGVSMTKTQVPAEGATDGVATVPVDRPTDEPPSWDPLGTARFAWDLPEPTVPPQPPAPRVPRSPVTPIFLGLAVITGAAGAAANAAGIDWFTPGRIASLVLAVLGIGLIVSAFVRRRGGSGLAWIAVIAAAVAITTTGLAGVGNAFPQGGVGDRTWHPPTASDLRDKYQLTVGSSTLDLRDVGDLDRDRTIDIRQGVGEIKILLPDDLRVRMNCTAGVGEVNCADGVVNPDAKTPTLTIDAHTAMGNVETSK